MGKEDKYYFCEDSANKVITFIEKGLVHTKGELAKKPFLLEEWQKNLVSKLFGWKVKKTGLRKYRTLYLEVPRKNGKSTLIAGLSLYLLFADGESGAEIVAGASERKQAGIIHQQAKEMILASPILSKHAEIFRDSVIFKNSFYRVISADAGSKHGYNLHACIIDELHAQKTRELFDVLTTSTGARRQPLTILVTTAGYDKNSICGQMHDYSRKLLSNKIKDETFLPVIYSADKDDDWKDEKTWEKANPNLDVSVKRDYLKEMVNRAKNSPSFENTFKRLHLNTWTTNESFWIKQEVWDSCNLFPVDTKNLKGRKCWAGLDLSSSIDISALVLIFPDDDGERFEVLPFFWIPKDNALERSRKDGVDYDLWIREGLITATEGNVIDYKFIKKQIEDILTTYQLKNLAYDRWGATQLVIDLQDQGCPLEPFGQGFASMSNPSKSLETMLLSKKINHGGNKVLNWMIGNTQTTQDPAGNIKPDKKKSGKGNKIDGIVALIMSIGLYLDDNFKGRNSDSIYNERDVIIL